LSAIFFAMPFASSHESATHRFTVPATIQEFNASVAPDLVCLKATSPFSFDVAAGRSRSSAAWRNTFRNTVLVKASSVLSFKHFTSNYRNYNHGEGVYMQSVIADSLQPNGRRGLPFLESVSQTLTGRIFVAVAATALIAAGAHVSFRLPFTPVPLTLSDFAVILVGMALGPVAGFSAVLLYLAEGAAGLPVFNPEGLGGIAQLLGPTAGYLFAYPIAAAAAGLVTSIRRSGMSHFTAAVVMGTIATTIILGMGAAWLSHVRYLSAAGVYQLAIAPFLFGAAAKVVAAALIFSSTRRWLRS
jgi:biotin transport system substrate-specific component